MLLVAQSNSGPPLPESLSTACRDFLGLCFIRFSTTAFGVTLLCTVNLNKNTLQRKEEGAYLCPASTIQPIPELPWYSSTVWLKTHVGQKTSSPSLENSWQLLYCF